MKKILTAIFALTLISCSSDREPISNENPLVGIWKMEKTTTISGKDNTSVISENLPDECKQKSTYEFNKDGNYIVNEYNNTNAGCVLSSRTTAYNYNQNEKKLTIGPSTSKVLELTQNRLMIYVADNYDSNDDGVNDFLRYSFKR